MKRMLSIALAMMLFTQGVMGGTAIAESATTVGEVQILTSGPQVTTFNPPAQSGQVALDSGALAMSLTFDRQISVGTDGYIKVKDALSGYAYTTIDIQALNSMISSDEKSVTFNATNLIAGKEYVVEIPSGTFIDKNDPGSSFSGISGDQWSFVADDELNYVSFSPGETPVITTTTPTLQINFERDVQIGSGKIWIFQGDTAVRGYDVSSATINGSTVTLPISTALTDKQTYNVRIESGAFKDKYNLPFKGITDSSTWTFTIASDSTGPTIVSISPSTTTGVSLGSSFVITMSEEVTLNTSGVKLKRSGSTISTSVSLSSNKKQITVKPTTSLLAGYSYSIVFESGAVKDLVGNSYSGNSTIHTFSTLAADTTIPVLESAVMSKTNMIELTYSKSLDSSSTPLTSSYKVTVNDEERPLSSVVVVDKKVYIYLQSGVAVGQVINISYTQSGNILMDTNGNKASSFSLREVTNSVEDSMTRVISSSATGAVVQLTFSDSLKELDTNAKSQFVVSIDGVEQTPISAISSGTVLILGLGQTLTDGQVVTVKYVPGSYPIMDNYEANISGFGPIYIRNSVDTKAPVLQSAEVDGKMLVLNYNEGLNSEYVPMKSYYSVLVNNSARFVTDVEVKNNQVILTLASSVSSKNDSVTLSYVPGIPYLLDLAGNQAGAFSLISVGNETDSSLPQVNKATVSDNLITLEFNKQLNNSNVPSTNYFSVRVDNSSREVNTVNVDNSIVTLTLSEAVTLDQKVYVTYSVPGSKYLVDLGGNIVSGFSSIQAVNSTSSSESGNTGTMPSYLSEASANLFLKDLLLFNTTQATKTTDRSLSGQYVNRYSVDDADWKTAMEYASSIGHEVVAVDLIAAEGAAIVAIPFKSVAEMVSSSSANKELKIGIRYGNWLYTIALEDFSVSEITSDLGTTEDNITLLFQIDKQSGTLGSNLTNTIRTNSGSVIVEPYQFQVSAYTSTPTEKSSVLEINTEISNRITQSIVKDQTSAVRLDTSTGNKLIYVPSQITTEDGAIVLNAQMSKTDTIAIARGNKSFTDVGSHWAASDINALASRFVVDAYSGDKFEPDQAITRAEFAVFVVKALGLDGDASQAMRFSDVSQSSAAAPYIGAAVKAGIITGVASNKFEPNSIITREQMAIMLSRAMTASGNPVSLQGSSSSYLTLFDDYKTINGTATDAVAKMVYADIISGMSGNKFGPKAQATRAQAAVMIRRMMANIGYL